MNRLQIQIPTPVYNKLKRVSDALDYSMAELIRRGIEQIIMHYPQYNDDSSDYEEWKLPEPGKLGMKNVSSSKLREMAYEK